jgi:putative oxidoreductase
MKNKILFVLCLLMGLMFINSGLNKFFWYMPMPESMPEKVIKSFEAYTTIGWIMPLVAIAEIIGGIMLIFKRYRALGAIILFPIMVGVLLTHIVIDPSGFPVAMAMMGILIWVLYENREKYMPMVRG